jgi:hypothetical protein
MRIDTTDEGSYFEFSHAPFSAENLQGKRISLQEVLLA